MKSMSKKIIAIGILGLALFIGGCMGTSSDNTTGTTQTAMAKENTDINIAGITLEDLNGNKLSLDSYKGTPIYLDMWGSWCPICVRSLPEINKLSADKNKGFEIVTVVFPNIYGEKDLAGFKTWFTEQNKPNIKVLVDKQGILLKKFNVHAFPTSLVINDDLSVKYLVPGKIQEETIIQLFKQK